MKTSPIALLALAVALCGVTYVSLIPSRAVACGGCFGPTDTVTVVTAHRMAVSIGAGQTTLWDQIEYAGDPRDFVWVLPIQGEVLVELADNAFFEALNQGTQINLQATFGAPQTFCPDPCFDGTLAGSRGADGGASAVTVYGEAVVGPYETSTIGSDDPAALVTWLQEHDYAVSDAMLPIIAHYVDAGLNFAVLRLAPNAGVSQMQPVRVTTPGSMPVFPLRMVAAGVEGKVGLELYIIGEGRYGAANFEVGEIDRSSIVYDWSTARFNYGEVFDQTLADLGGRAWIAEYARPSENWSWLRDYTSYDPDTGESTTPAADFDIALTGLSAPYLTKLRTDLLASFLDEDLVLEADLGGELDNQILVDHELNRPADVTCSTVCTDPRSPTGGLVTGGTPRIMAGGRGDGLCTVQPGAATGGLFFAGILASALGIFLTRRRSR